MNIVIYQNLYGFKEFLTFVQNKEIFLNGSFQNIPYVLIALEKNALERKEISSNNIKATIKKTFLLNQYVIDNQDELEKLKPKLLDLGHDFSWLQIMQIHVINKEDELLESNVKELLKFYEKNIPKELNF
jgi:hypothetical protein